MFGQSVSPPWCFTWGQIGRGIDIVGGWVGQRTVLDTWKESSSFGHLSEIESWEVWLATDSGGRLSFD